MSDRNDPATNVPGRSSHSLSNVFSIDSGTPFLPELVSSLCSGSLIKGFNPDENPLLLPSATIFVPSRRAARELSMAFLDASGSKPRLLPSIRTLGDVSDDEFGVVETLDDTIAIPRAIGSLDRKLQLAVLVEAWVNTLSDEMRNMLGDEDIFIPASQADAIYLAEDLCRLLDEITQEECGWKAVERIVPEEHAEWWGLTSTFLSIITAQWPKLLSEDGLVDPGYKSLFLLNRRTNAFRDKGSVGPVIVAGSTGSVPSTRRLLDAVSRLPNGAIVLPGLDRFMPTSEWEALTSSEETLNAANESHPQFGLSKLLEYLGVDRDNVCPLGGVDAPRMLRGELVRISQALPEFTANWIARTNNFSADEIAEAFSEVSLIEAGNERQEALSLALVLREALETADKTAALVTPDRNLAHRVAIELRRFGIEVDDSAGTPFSKTLFGQFVRLTSKIGLSSFSKTDLTALLKSPLLRAGFSGEEARKHAEEFELCFLRGLIGRPSTGGFSDWILGRTAASRSNAIGDEKQDAHALQGFLQNLDEAFSPLQALRQQNMPLPLQNFVTVLLQTLEGICKDEQNQSTIQEARGFEEFSVFVDDLQRASVAGPTILPDDFPAVLDSVMSSLTVRSRGNTHPRLHIYGPLEIRLLDYDRIILGGLNEGTWPTATRSDAFLNRLMRQQLGLASPERGTGLAAHDFQQLMGKAEVVLSRASRVDKSPTVASRWVQRLVAVTGEAVASQMRERGSTYLSIATALEEQGKITERAVTPPQPKPPVAVRPKSLPVTDIETWIRDPYALYAKRILNLKPLEPLEREPDPRLFGTLYHDIAETYVDREQMNAQHAERLRLLLSIAQDKITAAGLPEDVEALALARFENVARQFANWEESHFASFEVGDILKEVSGGMDLAENNFRLHARADRIDVLKNGGSLVMDYKTGSSPTLEQAKTLSPQMALEGAIARSGGFPGVPAGNLQAMAFVRMRHGSGFKWESLAQSPTETNEIVDDMLAKLEDIIRAYNDPAQGYVSRRAPYKTAAMDGDYDHLARVREWSFGAEEGDE